LSHLHFEVGCVEVTTLGINKYHLAVAINYMSVWKTACYRDDPLQWYLRNAIHWNDDCEFVRSLCDFTVEEFGDFPVPEGVVAGNFRKTVETDPDVLRRTQSAWSKITSKSIAELAKTLGPAQFGLKAVYRISAKILERAETAVVPEFKDDKFFDDLIKLGFAASSHSARDFDYRRKEIKHFTQGKFAVVKKVVRDLVRLRGIHRAKSYQAEVRDAEAVWGVYPQVPENLCGFFHNWRVWAFPGALLLEDPVDEILYLLTPNDIERIDRILTGSQLSVAYVKGYGNEPGAKQDRLIRKANIMVDHMVRTFKSAVRVNEVCRAYDVAYHYMLATRGSMDDHRAESEQKAKWKDEKLEEIFPLHEYLAITADLAPKEAIEVCMIYKVLPQPDFDYYGAAKRQLDMYEENVRAAKEDGAAQGKVFDEILLYHKWTMLYAFWKTHGKCPGVVKEGAEDKPWHARYPYIKPNDVDFTEVGDIDFAGDFVFRGRKTDILDLVNDKATCPKKLKDTEMHQDLLRRPLADRNQLIDVLMRESPIDLTTLDRKTMNYDLKADDKPESKKPNGRWFFEASTEARLKQSEYEDSISYYAKSVVGCFSGKSHSDKVKQMNAITDTIPVELPSQALFCQFRYQEVLPLPPPQSAQSLGRSMG